MASELWVRRNLQVRSVFPTAPATPAAATPAAQNLLGRGLAGLAVATLGAGCAFALAQAALLLWVSSSQLRVDAAVGLGVTVIGALVAAWYAITGVGVTLSVVSRRGLGVARWGAPLARRLSVGFLVTALGTAALPAMADSTIPDDLTWAGLVTLMADNSPGPIQGVAPPVVIPTTVTDSPIATPSDRQHVVQPGESLWRISAAELPGASNAQIAARVQAWIHANPQLAANPDLILIGQRITIPGDPS